MSLYIWLNNIELGVRILRQKLRTSVFGHPSHKRIKEYKAKLNSHFDNLEQWVFLNEILDHKGDECVDVITHKDDNLYAPCVRQLLWDHFKIRSKIVKYDSQYRVTISKGSAKKDIDVNRIKNYIVYNLYHGFNLYRGSIPVNVCKFIRELETAVTKFGIFEPSKGMRVYWTIDMEAQLAYFDNKRRMSTNIFSSENKYALLLSETLKNIRQNLDINHTYFIPMELLDYNGKDALGNTFCNIAENREAVRALPSHASVAFHGYHHNEYKRRWSTGELTEEYVENEITRGSALMAEVGINSLSANRYPGLCREPFALSLLEKYGFKIDMSDLIDDSTLSDFSAYCRYRLLKLDGEIIRPSKVWEIPVIYADPYVIGSNPRRIENLAASLKHGVNYHNSEVALMFHDVIIGFPEDTNLIFNLNDGRLRRVGLKVALLHLVSQLKELTGDWKEEGGINIR